MHESEGGAAGTQYVDLHIHTKFSDGACTVEQIIDQASKRGLRSIAITDHDNTDGCAEAIERGLRVGLEVIPATELSAEIEGHDIHVLGYFVDPDHPRLRLKLGEMKEARIIRAEKIVQNLNRQGIDLRFETVLKIAGNGAIGRPHIATAMLQEELVYSFKEAFERFIGYDSPAYVEKLKMTPAEVFALVREAGGLPVLAHPGVTRVDERIPQFVRDGLAGIEVFHSEHSYAAQRFYTEFCRKNGLLFTGGSDFHSPTQTRAEVGYPKVPYVVVEKLKERLKQSHI